MTAPEPVRRIVEAWVNAGCPPQPGIQWPRENWCSRLSGLDPLINALPQPLDRESVRQFGVLAHDNAGAALEAFIVTMVWGYGDVGYGPWRTAKILADSPDALERLLAVARALDTGGALDGYRLMATGARLPGLGPAFGTKYLHFCSTGPAQQRALVLDQNVASWLDRNVALRLNPTTWSGRTYARYLEHLRSWATELGRKPGEVEYCIIQDEVNTARRGQWSTN